MKPSDEAKTRVAGERPVGGSLDEADAEHGDAAGDPGLAEPARDLARAPGGERRADDHGRRAGGRRRGDGGLAERIASACSGEERGAAEHDDAGEEAVGVEADQLARAGCARNQR